MDSKDIEKFTREAEIMRDAIEHPGVKLLMQKLHEESARMTDAQTILDPYKEPDKIIRAQMFRFIVNTVLPEKIESLVDFDPSAVDYQVAPKWRWSVADFLKRCFKPVQSPDSG